jgi:hypothetical protein
MMKLIRDEFVDGNLSSLRDDRSGITLVEAEEFA